MPYPLSAGVLEQEWDLEAGPWCEVRDDLSNVLFKYLVHMLQVFVHGIVTCNGLDLLPVVLVLLTQERRCRTRSSTDVCGVGPLWDLGWNFCAAVFGSRLSECLIVLCACCLSASCCALR